MQAVTIPTGISTGEIIVLDIVSAVVRKDAPNRNEHGTSILLSTPIVIRSIWGIKRPTNPIGPVTDITEAAADANLLVHKKINQPD